MHTSYATPGYRRKRGSPANMTDDFDLDYSLNKSIDKNNNGVVTVVSADNAHGEPDLETGMPAPAADPTRTVTFELETIHEARPNGSSDATRPQGANASRSDEAP